MTIQTLLRNFIDFIDGTLLPVLMAVAVLFFVVNVIRYFIIGGANEESQEKAKKFALWGIIALVIFVGFWGVVRIVTDVIGVNGNTNPIIPDYKCLNDNDSSNDGDCREEGSGIIDDTSNIFDGVDLGDTPFTS